MRKNPYIGVIKANGHDFVEIGGIKWATCNIGANKPWESGLYFAWGETDGYLAGGNRRFSRAEYKFGREDDCTKYCDSDGKMFLELEDDAAYVHWGGNWRIPTQDDYDMLQKSSKCRLIRVYQGIGINGLLCSDKTDDSKTIFFPAAGFCCSGYGIDEIGNYGLYWTNELSYPANNFNARSLGFTSSYFQFKNSNYRSNGFTIRPVLDC